MKIAYFECHSGISGDMILGALVDLGVPLATVEKELKKLPLKGYRLDSKKVKRSSLGATQVIVDCAHKPGKHHHHHPHRTYTDIKQLIEKSKLSPTVQKNALKIFESIAKAEAKIHRTTIKKIHFHEVGAVDSIIDIVGSAIAFEALGFDRIFASPLNTGEGTVECDHGVLPVPAPATLELLKGLPCYSSGIQTELTTPTGAAILSHYATEFRSLPELRISQIGYGAGSKILSEIPNVLRVVVGEVDDGEAHKICVIETNIDDMNPEFYEHVMESLYAKGALEVYFTPVQMKKNRPAVKLTVLCSIDKRDALARMVLAETTSFGLRWWEANRSVLERELLQVKTPYGVIQVKVGRLDGETLQVAPEYEACKKASKKAKVPLTEVYSAAQAVAKKMIR